MENFKKFNLENNIPIMRDKTIDALYHCFDNYSDAEILEIGTAYGYSAKYLSLHKNVKKIITLENNPERYAVAQKYLSGNSKIISLNVSAFDYKPNQNFDCIIIDGPKSHQEKLFEQFSKYLKPKGFIFVDNLNLFQSTNKEMTKNRIKLKLKVEQFKKYIVDLSKDWSVTIYDIDDGYAIIRRK